MTMGASKVLELRRYGDSVLRKTAARVEFFDDELAALADEMAEVMRREDGVGLAAPQIGLPLRLIVIDASRSDEPSELHVLVNPEIVSVSEDKAEDEEGCLSLPGISIKVNRPAVVTVKAQDVNGEEFVIENVDGLLARAIQHEIDHLNGILLIDHVSPVQRTLLRGKLKKISDGWRD